MPPSFGHASLNRRRRRRSCLQVSHCAGRPQLFFLIENPALLLHFFGQIQGRPAAASPRPAVWQLATSLSPCTPPPPAEALCQPPHPPSVWRSCDLFHSQF